VFKSPPVAKTVQPGDERVPATSGLRLDTVTLGWEERLRGRARRTSDGGFEFATALPRGTVLRGGDWFLFEAEGVIVRVAESREAMLVVRPSSAQEWGTFAYYIGNSHQPAMFVEDAIVCPDALGMDQILAYHAIPFVRERRTFTPLGQLSDHRHQAAR
jgi:urease accessory protein UreE